MEIWRACRRLALPALIVAGGLATLPARADGQGTTQGVTVRGDWVIKVVNPDGTVAEQREVKNAFVGVERLLRVLTGLDTAGPWSIRISTSSPSPCDRSLGSECQIVEPRAVVRALPGANLTVARESRDGAMALVLSGVKPITAPGQLLGLDSGIRLCTLNTTVLLSTAPNACTSGTAHTTFSQTTLALPLNVESGQQIFVTVALTFRSGGQP